MIPYKEGGGVRDQSRPPSYIVGDEVDDVENEYRADGPVHEIPPEGSEGEELSASEILVESGQVLRDVLRLVGVHILLEASVVHVRTSRDDRVEVHEISILPERLSGLPAVESEDEQLQREDSVLEEEVVDEV